MTDTRGYELISADSHVIEPADLFERLPSSLRGRAPKLESWNGGSAWMVEGVDPVPLPVSAATGSGYRLLDDEARSVVAFDEVLPALHDPAERLKAQDADSVDAEIIYPFPGLWDAVKELEDDELKLECVRAYNDWIGEFSAHSPDRLVGLGKIPATSREEAQEELVRCVEELHLRGVILDAWPGGSPSPGDPSDDPFWNTLNDTGVPVSIHYALGTYAHTAPPAGIAPGLNPPMADTAQPLVATGLFDRCPNVRVVFAHGDAGWAFHWLEQMDGGYLRRRHLPEHQLPFKDPDSLPSEYIRRHFWFTIHQDRPAVKNREKLGTAHLLWASHFPLDAANWPDDREQAIHLTEELPPEDKRAMLAENTARLYRLPGYEDGFSQEAVDAFVKLVHF